ncbi:complement factor B-like [Lineus longissimus]|uniref:complement factor B-like n=1 Tax=Lineus longissimus TaxID=88925 RepID=UPI002B4F009A
MSRVAYLGLLSLAYILQSHLAVGSCNNPPSLGPHGLIRVLPGSVTQRIQAVYECEHGYFLAGPGKRRLGVDSFIRVCIIGAWPMPRGLPRRPQCLLKSKCHANPTSPRNGQMAGHCCDDRDTVTFTCDQGYTLAGAEILQCSEGRWNGSAPQCTRGPVCQSPQKPNGIVRSRRSGRTFMPNDVISYKCDADHYFERIEEKENDYANYDDSSDDANADDAYADVGSVFVIYDYAPRKIKCMGNGRWNMPFPDCHAFTCDPPSPIRNAVIDFQGPQSSQYNGGRVISYSCSQEYILVGPSHRKCSMKVGGWTGNDPQCIQIRCPKPEAPEHGYIDNARLNKEGDTIHISCNRGYTLQGSSSMTCGQYADWSGTTPTCHKVNLGSGKCQAPVIPFGGRKIGRDSYRLNQVVTYKCHGSNRLIGPESIRCTTEGWLPSRQPKCQVPFSYDNPSELAKKFTRLFNKLENKTSEIENSVGDRGRYLDVHSVTGLDIYFLIDSSASITLKHFKKAVNFVKALVKKVGVTSKPNGARVGVTTFADDISIKFGQNDPKSSGNNGFHASQKLPQEQVLQLLDNLTWSEGSTNIRGALKFVRTVMLPMSLDSRLGAKQYLFLLSDGEDNVGGSPEPEAMLLKEPTNGDPPMEIFCVKIGLEGDAKRNVDNQKKLRAISSEEKFNQNGSDPHFFRLKNFPAFDILVQKIVERSIDYSECGIAGVETGVSTANIIGGDVATEHAWPWMASISVKAKNEVGINAFKHSCGGTLINSEWILTAAHCFQGELYEQNLGRIRVKLGSNQWKLEQDNDAIEVKSMHIHRGFPVDENKLKPITANFANDIALLRLKVSARLSDKTRTICLANNSAEHNALYNGTVKGVVAGWGFHENRTVNLGERPKLKSDDLRQVELGLKQKGSPNCEPPDEEIVVCAGSSAMEDSCVGDSGGPLMVHTARNAAGERRWYQIGIVSYGHGCAFGNKKPYARYTDVRHYQDWIKDTIKKATEFADQSN